MSSRWDRLPPRADRHTLRLCTPACVGSTRAPRVIGFLQPLALVGLVLGAIPPLLHLLGRRRPPTVVFPAIQYLTATEREHSRRLKLRNLLLMLLRVAVIVLLVLAAARPVIRVGGGSSHPPTSLGLVLDNSLSSSAVVAGQRTLDVLKERARDASLVLRAL